MYYDTLQVLHSSELHPCSHMLDRHILDTVTHRWIKPDVKGAKPMPRRAHTACLYNGRLFIFGGKPSFSLFLLPVSLIFILTDCTSRCISSSFRLRFHVENHVPLKEETELSHLTMCGRWMLLFRLTNSDGRRSSLGTVWDPYLNHEGTILRISSET